MKNIKRKGFTLVELLIVIVVIGILSAMMMMSSTEAVTSAKASNIISNMRNLKTAALAYYVDNLSSFDEVVGTAIDKEKVFGYLNGEKEVPEFNNYNISNDGGVWYITATITGSSSEKERIRSKLAGRAKSVGLYTTKSADTIYDGVNDTVVSIVRK